MTSAPPGGGKPARQGWRGPHGPQPARVALGGPAGPGHLRTQESGSCGNKSGDIVDQLLPKFGKAETFGFKCKFAAAGKGSNGM